MKIIPIYDFRLALPDTRKETGSRARMNIALQSHKHTSTCDGAAAAATAAAAVLVLSGTDPAAPSAESIYYETLAAR